MVVIRKRWLRRVATVVGVVGGLGLIAAAIVGLWLRGQLRASLPVLDGEAGLPGLEAQVSVRRDALGVPTIKGSDRLDVARATGFLHAQDRFFQMDLMRRSAAGELAGIVGPAALERDRRIRIHRFRTVATAVVGSMGARDRTMLAAYVEGVNAGLRSLGAPPFEYLLLRSTPAPWRAEDTVLTVLSMFVDLQPEDGAPDATLGLVHDLLPADWFEFLAPIGGPWDAPIEGGPLPPPALPGGTPSGNIPPRAVDETVADDVAGSNSWAVAGAHTAHGGAILANDMHLGLRVPNTWYRARFEWPEGSGEAAVTGVTLPGTPAMVVGSNGRVAWGFTNSYCDFVDLVVLELDPLDPDRYMGPDGWRSFERFEETIRVRGGGEERFGVTWTVWGPVVDEDHRGRPRAVRWTAHDPGAVNLGMADLEQARDVDEALAIAAGAGIPGQNFLCADADGRIGWTIMGRVPDRVDCDGRLPVDADCSWQGWLPVEAYPRVVDPSSGRLWTANARAAGGADLAVLGDGGYDLGARAGQIRDDLFEIEAATERDMLAIQLDDRAVLLEPWQQLLLELLGEDAVAADPRRAAARAHIEAWRGRAAVDSVGYRLVRGFHRTFRDDVIGALAAPVFAADPDFRAWRLGQVEGAVWRLAVERPPRLLPSGSPGWRDLMLGSLDRTVAAMLENHDSLDQATWGDRNTVRIRHPLSFAVPLLGRWLDMPAVELPGDADMPRVQSPSFGASERMVVSPGREAEGIFHMPCGQSGHPQSPFYRAGHEAWVRGEPTPFLPGEAVHELRLVPAATDGRVTP